MKKTGSFLTGLVCPKCGKKYDSRRIQHLCECGSPLLAEYDLKKARAEWKKESVSGRKPDLWRYRELLPVEYEENIVTAGEGMTPSSRFPAWRKAGCTKPVSEG